MVANDADAMKLIDIGGIDLAILDIMLLGTSTFAVADRLTAIGVPFIFSTGYEPKELPTRFADVPLCLKPTTIDCVAQKFASIISAKGGRGTRAS